MDLRKRCLGCRSHSFGGETRKIFKFCSETCFGGDGVDAVSRPCLRGSRVGLCGSAAALLPAAMESTPGFVAVCAPQRGHVLECLVARRFSSGLRGPWQSTSLVISPPSRPHSASLLFTVRPSPNVCHSFRPEESSMGDHGTPRRWGSTVITLNKKKFNHEIFALIFT